MADTSAVSAAPPGYHRLTIAKHQAKSTATDSSDTKRTRYGIFSSTVVGEPAGRDTQNIRDVQQYGCRVLIMIRSENGRVQYKRAGPSDGQQHDTGKEILLHSSSRSLEIKSFAPWEQGRM